MPSQKNAAENEKQIPAGPNSANTTTGENLNASSEQQLQGTFGADSKARPLSDVTAAANSGKPAQGNLAQNPFVVPVPAIPTQEGPLGIRYDFNDGARVLLPKGKWHVQIEDAESDNIIFACDSGAGWVLSAKKYYIPFRIKVWIQGEKDPVLNHTLDLSGKEVQIKFPVGTLGDIIGWLPYAEKFQKKHNCAAELTLAQNMVDLFSAQYPQMFFTAVPGKVKFEKPYASYRLGLLGE